MSYQISVYFELFYKNLMGYSPHSGSKACGIFFGLDELRNKATHTYTGIAPSD